MGLKFKDGNYLKCKGDCCDFIKVIRCLRDTGEEAEVVAIWYTRMQGRSFRQVSNETQFKISKRQYLLWRKIKVIGISEHED